MTTNNNKKRIAVASILNSLVKYGASMDQASAIASVVMKSRPSTIQNASDGKLKNMFLKAADAIIDSNPSYVSKPEVNSDAKTLVSEPSEYQSYAMCVSDLTDNYKVNSSDASEHQRGSWQSKLWSGSE